jgi:hypothetical protein
MRRFPVRRRFGTLGDTGSGGAPGSTVPFVSDAGLARGAQALGAQPWLPGTGIEENQGSSFWQLPPEVQEDLQLPGNPGIDTPSFLNPYRTVMYAVAGIDTEVPLRALGGNSKRTYLIVQNQGPGNLFLGIGTDPNSSGTNVMTLVATQLYEQIGGGFFLPPNPWYPKGLTICTAFVSPEYISLLTDTLGTTAMILEGSFSPPANSQWQSPWQAAPGSTGSTGP